MDSNKVGKFIAELRKSKNLTQAELAKSINVTNKAVSKWEVGTGLPDVSLLYPLSSTLGVSVTELLAGEFLEGENFNKSNTDEVTLRTLFYSKKRFLKMIRILIVSAILAILLVCLGWYFITSFNSIRVYRIRMKSGNFVMNDGFFMKSNMKNVFQMTEIRYVGSEEIKNGEFRAKIYVKDEENDSELVIYDGVYVSPVYIYEADGYNEYFTKRYASLLKDNLYITISYLNLNDEQIEETYKLETTLEFANNKLLEWKESSKDDLNVSESVNNYRKQEETQNRLKENGFEIVKDEKNLSTVKMIKVIDDLEVNVLIAENIVINISNYQSDKVNFRLSYDILSNLVRFNNSQGKIGNYYYDDVSFKDLNNESELKSLLLLNETLDLLNNSSI